MAHHARHRLPAFALVALALIFGALPATAAGRSPDSSPSGPLAYYLSLGDSLAFGYQPYQPLISGFGYYDDLAASLEQINPDLKPVNLGCPGETSSTFINGGCSGSALIRYTGSQLSTA